MKTRVIKLLAALLAVSSGSAFAAPSLDATGSGFDGLSPSSGPFGRTNLTPLTTVDPNGGLKVSISANGQRIEQVDASHSFDFVATLNGNGTANFGSLGGSFSFLLQAKPESIATQSGTVYNYGHSELVSHMRLTFNDSGIVNSGTLPAGSPVTMRFIIINRGGGSVSEPAGLGSNNPHYNDYFSGANSNGYVNLFDENSLAHIDDALFFENQITVIPFNSAVGHRVDLTAVYSIDGIGYAGLDGQIPGVNPFYQEVQGQFDADTTVYVQGPPGVSFTADTGHAYAPDTTVPRLLGNISTRGFVGTGANVMIGGFIIKGTTPKQVLLRALGPTLGQAPFNLPGALPDPVLELHAGNGSLIASNDNWATASNAAQITASGFAPPNSAECAILTTLAPGNYTVIVRGVNNSTGVALVECYDFDGGSASELGNISTRGFVQTGDKVLIAGIIVKGPANKDVIIRGLGPTLGQAPFNVPNVLANPVLDLRDANGVLLVSNDNWGSAANKQAIITSGLAPPNAAESAILVTLAPGNYTAILGGINNTIGNALVEAYGVN